jgi:hypothetical protein
MMNTMSNKISRKAGRMAWVRDEVGDLADFSTTTQRYLVSIFGTGTGIVHYP